MIIIWVLLLPDAFQRRKSYWPSLKFQKQESGYTEVEGGGHEKDSIVESMWRELWIMHVVQITTLEIEFQIKD